MNVLRGDWDQDPESHKYSFTDEDDKATQESEAAWHNKEVLKSLSIEASSLVINAEQSSLQQTSQTPEM